MSHAHSELLERMRDADSAVAALSNWLGVTHLVLDRVTANTNFRLGEVNRLLLQPHPGVLYGYQRTALLRTPITDESIASVEAIVLTARLPRNAAQLVLDARHTLGSILRGIGARREFIRATIGGRTDEVGRPVGLRVEARFVLEDEPIALVREDVYEDVIRGRRSHVRV